MKQYKVINGNCSLSRQIQHMRPPVAIKFSEWPSVENALISQKLPHKRRDSSAQQCNIGSYYHEIRKIKSNPIAHLSSRAWSRTVLGLQAEGPFEKFAAVPPNYLQLETPLQNGTAHSTLCLLCKTSKPSAKGNLAVSSKWRLEHHFTSLTGKKHELAEEAKRIFPGCCWHLFD